MNISYEGIGHFSVTFPAADCAVGAVCKMGSDGKMTGCADGDKFCGVAEVVTQPRCRWAVLLRSATPGPRLRQVMLTCAPTATAASRPVRARNIWWRRWMRLL